MESICRAHTSTRGQFRKFRIFTSAKEVMFSPGFVRLFVCEQDNSKTYGRILIKFSGYVRNGKRKKLLDLGSDPDHLDLLDP